MHTLALPNNLTIYTRASTVAIVGVTTLSYDEDIHASMFHVYIYSVQVSESGGWTITSTVRVPDAVSKCNLHKVMPR